MDPASPSSEGIVFPEFPRFQPTSAISSFRETLEFCHQHFVSVVSSMAPIDIFLLH